MLRRLADEGVAGASPRSWWGLAPLSDDAPLVPEDDEVRVRPSHIETFQRCPLRWVLGAVLIAGVVWLVRRWLRQRRLVRAARALPPTQEL